MKVKLLAVFLLFILIYLTFGICQPEGYITLTGDKNSYGDGSNDLFLNFSSDFSVMSWINGKNLSSYKRQDIVTKGREGDYEWALAVNSAKKPVFIIFNTDTNNYLTTTAKTTLKENQWYHIAGVFNGTAVYIYVNGKLEELSTGGQGSKSFTGKAKLIVGSRETPGADSPFNGSIDEIRIYNKSLGSVQIRRIYNESVYGSNLGQGIPALSYHRVEENSNDLIIVKPEEFSKQMDFLNISGYQTITYDDYYQWKFNKKILPEKPIIIVFDDGYTSVIQNAFPIMRKYGFVGVLGIIGSKPGLSGYMNWTELRLLHDSGWQIASHSYTHKDMTAVSLYDRAYEFEVNKKIIYSQLAIIPSLWIYPFNRNNDSIDIECAKYYPMCSGFSSGTSTYENFLFRNANLTQEEGHPIGLRRIVIGNETSLLQFKNAIDNTEGIVGFWKFDNSSDLGFDSSPYRNNLKLYNTSFFSN